MDIRKEDEKEERAQEFDPLISKKVSQNGFKFFSEENKPSSDIILKPITNTAQYALTTIEPVMKENANTENPSLNLQHQISTKSSRSNHKDPAINNDTPVSTQLSFFLQHQKDSSQRTLISPQISFVMFQFLFSTVRPFTSEFLTKHVLELIFKKALFKECKRIEKQQPEYLYRLELNSENFYDNFKFT